MESVRSEIQLLYSFMKYDYENLISLSFREFYKLSIDRLLSEVPLNIKMSRLSKLLYRCS